MGMGIYPVGLSPIQVYAESDCQVEYKQQMVKDRDTLRGLIVRVNAERERGKQHSNKSETEDYCQKHF